MWPLTLWLLTSAPFPDATTDRVDSCVIVNRNRASEPSGRSRDSHLSWPEMRSTETLTKRVAGYIRERYAILPRSMCNPGALLLELLSQLARPQVFNFDNWAAHRSSKRYSRHIATIVGVSVKGVPRQNSLLAHVVLRLELQCLHCRVGLSEPCLGRSC